MPQSLTKNEYDAHAADLNEVPTSDDMRREQRIDLTIDRVHDALRAAGIDESPFQADGEVTEEFRFDLRALLMNLLMSEDLVLYPSDVKDLRVAAALARRESSSYEDLYDEAAVTADRVADELVRTRGCDDYSHRAERYISLYSHERCYGGPEEGGWHYDWYELVPSEESIVIPPTVDDDVARGIARDLNKRQQDDEPYAASSCVHLVTREYENLVWFVEDRRGQNESTSRPRYE